MTTAVNGKQDSAVSRARIGTLVELTAGLAILIAGMVLWFAPQPAPKPDDTWTAIRQQEVLRIGVDPSSPPFVSDDGNGNLSGFDVALANELARRWNVRIQYVYTGYDGLYDALNGKQFDLVLSALTYNPLKTEDVNFSHSYFNGGPALVVRGGDARTQSLADLAGRTIAVELGTNGDAVARKWQKRLNLTLHSYPTAQDALRGAQRGEADAAIVDPITFYDFQRAELDTGVSNWRIVGKPLADELYVMAVRKDSPTLLRELNAVIDALKREGRMEELQKEHF